MDLFFARGLGGFIFWAIDGGKLDTSNDHWYSVPYPESPFALAFAIGFAGVVLLALQALSSGAIFLGSLLTSAQGAQPIRRRGRHLDELSNKDRLFISFSRLAITLFTYHLLRACALWQPIGAVAWSASELSISNTLLALPTLFIVYDFFYHWFHRLLHHRYLYKFIHKHHHRQMAPTRGNTDAVNVHPIEFIGGEYCHLLAIYLVSQILPVHLYTVLVFVVSAGMLASLNHTRLDVMFGPIFQVRYHDIHHWYPDSNYAQYTMFWDHIFATFKPYPEDEKKSK